MKASKLYLLFAILIPFLLISVGVSSWVTGFETKTDNTLNLDKVTGKIDNYIINGSTEADAPYASFTTLEGAIKSANQLAEKSTKVNIYLTTGSIIEVKNQYIKLLSGVNLFLPYKDKLIDIENSNQLTDGSLAANNFADASNENKRVSYFKLLNSTIEVCSGASLSIGGLTSTVGVVSSYSEIILDKTSSIIVEGEMTILGYVKRDSTINGFSSQYSNITDNSYDSKRFIEVKDSGKLTSFLGVYDMNSVGNLYTLNKNKIFPLNKFTFPCIQVYLKINYGATFSTIIHLNASGSPIIDNACIVSKSSSDYPLFKLDSGYISFELCSSNHKVTSKNYPLKVALFGNCSIGYITFFVQKQEISTKDKFLPISNLLKLFVCGDSVLDINYKIKILCGSLLRIESGASVNLNSELICYTYDKTIEALGDPSSLGNGKLINNGTLSLTSSAKIGALIETEIVDNSALIDLTNIDSSNLIVTSSESTDNNKITITSTGYFFDDTTSSPILGQFVPGSVVYSGGGGQQYWNGEYNLSYTLDVVVTDLYKYNLCGYRVYVADDENGTNSVELTSESIIESKSFSGISYKQYFKVDSSSKAKNTKFTTLPSGANYTFDSTKWYKMLGDITITITPNEGRLIKFTSQSVSGAGTTYYELRDQSNNSQIIKIKNSGQVIVANGTKFKVTFTGGINSSLKPVTFNTITKKNLDTGTSESVSDFESTFVADGNYEFYVTLKETETCFAEGTSILMADGTYKNIENIVYGDEIMTWNFFTGQYESQTIAIIVDHGEDIYQILELKFSNMKTLSIIGDHGLFDYDLNKFVYIDVENYKEYLNHRFAIYENGSTNLVTLVGASICEKKTHAYSITSAFNYNAIAGDLLTAPPPGEFYNWINMSDKMRYDVDEFNADIEKYGLYDYSVFEPYGISYETFVAFNGQYLKIPVEKGIFSFDYIIKLFNQYKDWING